MIIKPNKDPGYTCTVESPSFRVTIEHRDIMSGSFNDLFDVIKSACLGIGFSSNIVDEFFEPNDSGDSE